MLPLDSYNPRSLWVVLPPLTKLYILAFFFASVYIIFSLALVLFGLRSLKRRSRDTSHEVLRPTFVLLQARLVNLRQALFFLCLLFGLCFFLQLPAAFNVLGDSNVPALSIIFMQLGSYIAYATDVLLVFVLLHSAQWFVWVRLQSFATSHHFN
jgi:hypothetical protein